MIDLSVKFDIRQLGGVCINDQARMPTLEDADSGIHIKANYVELLELHTGFKDAH